MILETLDICLVHCVWEDPKNLYSSHIFVVWSQKITSPYCYSKASVLDSIPWPMLTKQLPEQNVWKSFWLYSSLVRNFEDLGNLLHSFHIYELRHLKPRQLYCQSSKLTKLFERAMAMMPPIFCGLFTGASWPMFSHSIRFKGCFSRLIDNTTVVKIISVLWFNRFLH